MKILVVLGHPKKGSFNHAIAETAIKTLNRKRLKRNALFFILLNLFWLIFRTGTKPTRITYPCQQTAINNLSISLSAFIPISIITPVLTTIKTSFLRNNKTILVILLVGVFSGGLFLRTQVPNPSQEFQLIIEPNNATVLPASDIYVVNGRAAAHISELIDLMSSNDLFFYKSSIGGGNQNFNGLIAQNDVVLLKINSQWPSRGGTNTDLLKEVIQAIIDHPDSFVGEIIVADNGQGFGSMDFFSCNAENTSQSTQDVVNMFSSIYQVSTYDWQDIRGKSVDEYSEGDITDGYVVYDTADPETGIYVSYPKFKTEFGTNVSFKYGIWNGTGYEKRLKVINMPILKSHHSYGVTAALKNYMGVQSEGRAVYGGLANGHESVATGGMGTLMVEYGLPTLNIIDAIWVNAHTKYFIGPSTRYRDATRVNILLAGVDPAALDYWAANHILIETARLIGYNDTQILEPDNIEKGNLEEAFGVWLNLTRNEILRGGHNVTTDENRMNIFVYENHTIIPSSSMSSTSLITSQISNGSSSISNSSSTNLVPNFGYIFIVLSLITLVLFFQRRKKY